jgi:hypothetical protein
MLGPLVGGAVGSVACAVTMGLSWNALKVGLFVAAMFCAPATLVLGVPIYFAIRRTRRILLGWAMAFGAAITAAPAFGGVMLVGPAQLPDPRGVLVVSLLFAGDGLICGAVAGLVFWLVVVRGRDSSLVHYRGY